MLYIVQQKSEHQWSQLVFNYISIADFLVIVFVFFKIVYLYQRMKDECIYTRSLTYEYFNGNVIIDLKGQYHFITSGFQKKRA